MLRSCIYLLSPFLLYVCIPAQAQQKTLSLKEAIQTAFSHYNTIKAKTNYLNASRATLKGTYREQLPDLSFSVQQSYGSINGQLGPLYGSGGLGIASGGPPLESQNWTGAFGALYLANLDWDFYAFGRVRERINISKATLTRDELDLEQEKFQHQVRVATAYLNLLAAQRLTRSQQNNLERATALRTVVIARTLSGLNAGVDSSLANAELSAARIALIRSQDVEQEQANQLAQLMGVTNQDFQLDTLFISRIPAGISDTAAINQQSHPLLRFFQSRVEVSNSQVRFQRTFNYPTFTLFSVIQGRGSGFKYNYGELHPQAYSGSYLQGIRPQRSNYLVGAGMVWNITSPLRVQQQVAAQRFTSQALQYEYELTSQQLQNQLVLAGNKIRNAVAAYEEAPRQIKAARDAYTQKSVLYKNGLTDIVDATQALYAVNRAETDRDIAYTNVWQALLLKAAASGDFGLFINEF